MNNESDAREIAVKRGEMKVKVHTGKQNRRNKNGRGRNNKTDAMEIAGNKRQDETEGAYG